MSIGRREQCQAHTSGGLRSGGLATAPKRILQDMFARNDTTVQKHAAIDTQHPSH